jgi:hypothetical protein
MLLYDQDRLDLSWAWAAQFTSIPTTPFCLPPADSDTDCFCLWTPEIVALNPMVCKTCPTLAVRHLHFLPPPSVLFPTLTLYLCSLGRCFSLRHHCGDMEGPHVLKLGSPGFSVNLDISWLMTFDKTDKLLVK